MTLFNEIAPAKALGFVLVGLTKVIGLSALAAGVFTRTRPLGAPLLVLAALCLIAALGIGLHFRSVEGKEDEEVAKAKSQIQSLARQKAALQEEVESYRSQLETRDDLLLKHGVRAR